MSYFPLNYEKINQLSSYNIPTSVKSRNNKAFDFWCRVLYERIAYSLKITTPWEDSQNAQINLLKYTLFRVGFGLVAQDKKFGSFFMPCTVHGCGFLYQPIKAVIANPLLEKEYTIDEDCAIVKLRPDYRGCWDIIAYFAEKLSLVDNSMNIALINSKNAFMLFAKNKAAAQAMKKGQDLINSGEPSIVFDSRVLVKDDNVSGSEPIIKLDFKPLENVQVALSTFELYTNLLNEFDNMIGINTLPYSNKKERMVVDEANSKKVESQSMVTVWKEEIEKGFNKANELFNLNLKVELRNDEDGDGLPETTLSEEAE